MKFILTTAILLSSLSTFATTSLQCDQITNGTLHQRFLISLDSNNRILKLKNLVWNTELNQVIGHGPGSFHTTSADKAVAYEAEDGTLVYNYQLNEDLVQVDVMVVLSSTLEGLAKVQVIEVQPEQISEYQLNCVLKN